MLLFRTKVGSLEPVLPITVYQGDGTPLDLTSVTTTFTMKDRASGATKVNAAAVNVTDAVAGKMEYRWIAGDVDTAGAYRGLFRLVLASGKPLILPSEAYIDIVIEPV